MSSNPSSISAWNEYLKSFINELCETFPECPDLFALLGVVDVMIDDDEHSVLHKFIEEIEPHTEALTNMDEAFFLEADIDFLKKLGVKQYWTPDLEQETKQAIWQYLQTLLVMGKTILSVPPEMLRMLEDYANKITSQMEDGEMDPSQLDLQSLGLGAIRHMQSGGGSSASQAAGMFGNIFENMSQQPEIANMGNMLAQNPLMSQVMSQTANDPGAMARMINVNAQQFQQPNTQTTARPVPAGASGGGGFDRFLGQFATVQQQQHPGTIWGTPTSPLHGHHPAFTTPGQQRQGGK